MAFSVSALGLKPGLILEHFEDGSAASGPWSENESGLVFIINESKPMLSTHKIRDVMLSQQNTGS
jgi:hypothetical protein